VADLDELRRLLAHIDGRGYKAYGDIRGRFNEAGISIFVDHVQGDPFAAPSRLRVRVPMQEAELPASLFAGPVRRMALGDFLARELRAAIEATARPSRSERSEPRGRGHRGGRSERGGERGSGKSGLVFVDCGGQEVLERSAIRLTPDFVEARIEVGLPAAGRRVLGREAETLLCERLPQIAERALRWQNLSAARTRAFVECVENQEAIRDQLGERGLVAFVADGSILPRESGASERPMPKGEARPFTSPPSHRVELSLPNAIPDGAEGTRTIRGMGIRRGITLIVGGGYHGKSTLLRALECCVHAHVPGDGREYVVAAPDLVKIRAEDGRSVQGVDIHAFIDALPEAPGQGARDTRAFSSDDASGSTSQAANIVEAIEVGAGGLLLDEDTSATNFMLRDARMQQLVARDHEPITPFVDRVRALYESLGVSTVLVMGGCGDYFEMADSVIMMRDFQPEDVTDAAQRIAAEQPSARKNEVREALQPIRPRAPLAASFDPSRGRRDVAISAKSRELILYGRRELDLRDVTQLLDTSQTRAVAYAIHLASEGLMGGGGKGASAATLSEVLDALDEILDRDGLDALDPRARGGPDGPAHPGNLARPRRFEIAAAINRLRGLRVEAQKPS
jgi:predicted ABC-class ATPase